jgi:hypothetical protein
MMLQEMVILIHNRHIEDKNSTTNLGSTLLHAAPFGGNTEVLKYMMSNAKNKNPMENY